MIACRWIRNKALLIILIGFYWPRRVEAAALQKQGAAKFLLLTLPAVNFF